MAVNDGTVQKLMFVSGIGLIGIGSLYFITGDASPLSSIAMILAGICTGAYPKLPHVFNIIKYLN